jgi:hypothetical protein
MVSEAALKGLATEQVELGRRLWREHQMQPGGVCVACGHVYPCNDAQRGAWMLLYWTEYLREEEARN